MTKETERLIERCELAQLVSPVEPFNAPGRVQRLTDLIGELRAALVDPSCDCPCYRAVHRMSDHARLVRS